MSTADHTQDGDVPRDELRTQRIYSPSERPMVQVFRDGEWFSGELRMWSRDAAGAWWAQCSWTKAPGLTYIDTFEEAEVRLLA